MILPFKIITLPLNIHMKIILFPFQNRVPEKIFLQNYLKELSSFPLKKFNSLSFLTLNFEDPRQKQLFQHYYWYAICIIDLKSNPCWIVYTDSARSTVMNS